MYVTGVTGDGNLLIVARGANGTAAAAHGNGAAVVVLTDYSVNPVPTCSLVPPAPCLGRPPSWPLARPGQALQALIR